MNLIPNFHILTVKFLGPTDTKGARISIRSDRFKQTKTISFNYEYDTLNGAEHYLALTGFNLIGHAEGKDCYYVITDTFEGFKKYVKD